MHLNKNKQIISAVLLCAMLTACGSEEVSVNTNTGMALGETQSSMAVTTSSTALDINDVSVSDAVVTGETTGATAEQGTQGTNSGMSLSLSDYQGMTLTFGDETAVTTATTPAETQVSESAVVTEVPVEPSNTESAESTTVSVGTGNFTISMGDVLAGQVMTSDSDITDIDVDSIDFNTLTYKTGVPEIDAKCYVGGRTTPLHTAIFVNGLIDNMIEVKMLGVGDMFVKNNNVPNTEGLKLLKGFAAYDGVTETSTFYTLTFAEEKDGVTYFNRVASAMNMYSDSVIPTLDKNIISIYENGMLLEVYGEQEDVWNFMWLAQNDKGGAEILVCSVPTSRYNTYKRIVDSIISNSKMTAVASCARVLSFDELESIISTYGCTIGSNTVSEDEWKTMCYVYNYTDLAQNLAVSVMDIKENPYSITDDEYAAMYYNYMYSKIYGLGRSNIVSTKYCINAVAQTAEFEGVSGNTYFIQRGNKLILLNSTKEGNEKLAAMYADLIK